MFQEIAAVERLNQEGDRAISQGLPADVIVIMGSNQNDWKLAPCPSNPPLQFRPIHTRQPHINNDARHVRQRSGLEKRFRGFKERRFVSGRLQNALERLPNTTIVVNSCDDETRRRLHARIVRTAPTHA